MNISHFAQTRYTTKVFDPVRKIPEATLAQLCTLLRNSPSSVNSQPWHFLVASSEEGKARVAKATQDAFAFNEPKVKNAATVIVLCARTAMEPAQLAHLLEQEQADGRFASEAAKAGQDAGRNKFVNLHRFDHKDLQHWMEKQVYLALGTLLLGAATLEVDACPMEGFNAAALDAEFGLREKGLTSVVVVSLGYRSDEDFNAKLPKSRLPAQEVLTIL
jgi:nitroreductase/dihydropteridine reductase